MEQFDARQSSWSYRQGAEPDLQFPAFGKPAEKMMSVSYKDLHQKLPCRSSEFDVTKASASRQSLENNHRFVIHVYSRHPLALQAIKQAICADLRLADMIEPLPADPGALAGRIPRILVLDTFLCEQWPRLFQEWRSCGCNVIALFCAGAGTPRERLEVLSGGASGIVDMGENLADELPKAISAVAQSKLWINREMLEEYVKQTSSVMQRLLCSDDLYTEREREIVNIVVRGHSNKMIAGALGISERTVKFHVSNILKKSQIDTRKEIIKKLSSKVTASDVSQWDMTRSG
jgi:DNA-binding NarL/FixJ family response regulator